MNQKDRWRTLLKTPDKFIDALVKVGVPRDAALEYLDDPGALPRDLRRKLNNLLKEADK